MFSLVKSQIALKQLVINPAGFLAFDIKNNPLIQVFHRTIRQNLFSSFLIHTFRNGSKHAQVTQTHSAQSRVT